MALDLDFCLGIPFIKQDEWNQYSYRENEFTNIYIYFISFFSSLKSVTIPHNFQVTLQCFLVNNESTEFLAILSFTQLKSLTNGNAVEQRENPIKRALKRSDRNHISGLSKTN